MLETNQPNWLSGGENVLVYEVVYRERVAPNMESIAEQPIVYMSAPGQNVVYKCSDVWQPNWKKTKGHHFFAHFNIRVFFNLLSETTLSRK